MRSVEEYFYDFSCYPIFVFAFVVEAGIIAVVAVLIFHTQEEVTQTPPIILFFRLHTRV